MRQRSFSPVVPQNNGSRFQPGIQPWPGVGVPSLWGGEGRQRGLSGPRCCRDGSGLCVALRHAGQPGGRHSLEVVGQIHLQISSD